MNFVGLKTAADRDVSLPRVIDHGGDINNGNYTGDVRTLVPSTLAHACFSLNSIGLCTRL